MKERSDAAPAVVDARTQLYARDAAAGTALRLVRPTAYGFTFSRSA